MKTQIISLNTRGLGNTQKRKQVFEWLKMNQYDIILFQEACYSTNLLTKWKEDWNGPCAFSGNSTNSEGVAILINPKSNITIIKYTELKIGRLLAIDIKINDEEITIINIYGPNKDEPAIFDQLMKFLHENEEKTFIIGGDFNTVLNCALDKKNGKLDTHKNAENL